MAGDEIAPCVIEIGRPDRPRAKAQMRDRHRAGFFRIVNEISLREIVRVFADDFDRLLVRAHGSVRAEPVKQRADNIVGFGRECRIEIEAGVRDVIVDADGEMILRRRSREIVEHGLDHRRREFLRGQTVAAADDSRTSLAALLRRAR